MESPVPINFYYIEDGKDDITGPIGQRHQALRVASSFRIETDRKPVHRNPSLRLPSQAYPRRALLSVC